MKKKIFALCLVICLLAVAVVTGTMAYLQDSEAKINVMTVGKVAITQNEKMRDTNGNLVDFVDKNMLVPYVGTFAWDSELLDVNGYKAKVMDEDSIKNVMDKIVYVTNDSNVDAYVRTIILLEAIDGDKDNLIGVVTFDDGTGNQMWVQNWEVVEYNGIEYVMMSVTYKNALEPEEKSAPSLVQAYMAKHATNENIAAYGTEWNIIALSQGVQAAGFGDAVTALDTAFGEVTVENVQKWLAELAAAGNLQ